VDVVHFYNAASIFGGLIVLSLGKPLVITLDGVEWERDKWGTVARAVWRLSTWLAIRLATEVVCDSKVVKALLEKRLEANLKYIPYGAKCVEAASGNNGNFGLERSRYYVFVGRLVPEKAVELLLDAYAELSQSMPLVIIGDNEDDPEYVSGLHRRAKGNVKFLGFRYGAEYEGLLSHARAYLSASKVEGTSPSLLTAMGSRVCCLVRGIPENRETGGDSVLYFDGTIEDLIEKWRLVMDNHDVVAEYGLRGYERVKSTYDWAVVTEQYIAAYHCAIRDAVSK
jgi:glycosyltransferase involved in cell wall biosynthesis